MNDQIFERIRGMIDVPKMGNTLRGLWAEAMVAELLGDTWKHTGNDWAGWDFESNDGLRLELKQSAKHQTWGVSRNPPRFNIKAAKGYYPDGVNYHENTSGRRFADIYVFAWHEAKDQRVISEWAFFVLRSRQLPLGQKSIGLKAIQKLTGHVKASALRETVKHLASATSH